MRNFFERFTSSIGGEKKGDGALEQEVKETIRLRADIRRREQQLNTDALNATPLGLTNAMKTAYDTTLARMRREASGAGDPVKEDAVFLCARAGVNKDLFPLLAGYDAARAARARVDAGEDPQRELAMARAYAGKEKGAPKISPSNLLPDAIILGVEKSVAGKRELPLPETIARGVANDPRLLADYALVLDEKDRPGFMATIPEKHQREVSAILDASVARVLHQALIAKGEGGEKSSEETQRAEVRRRLFAELKTTAEKKDSDDRHMAGILTEAMVTLGEDTRQLLLEIIRDEAEGGDAPSRERRGHFPRIIKVFLDEFDDWKGNDVILRLAGDQRLNHHLSLYLFGKLIDKGYLSKDVGEWWTASKKSKKKNIEAD